ncbi:histidinol-phosphate aminotransferase [Rhodococcus sp. PvR044]|jgi:histidinol-phosphate aminotransferase|uniref:histidinol-phosphate transaminase n=1 Tax=unclassified Rhodococcus (in: high G+C Gram-positive bacteria) TaxID=192944 RepID=UPI000BD51674|nr:MULTISPECIES: histidinol-phosphate transaminase [unclassified Rhodococcus (in: high G+C Gram-positive bacteria)]MBP1161170.1 histidinol-phosphate aminotransferase [Rhodococcus sp. PvR099]PTR39564.1 histidinol-phosphate aminotransferase [Rhodococcus sp. OK611]SNX92715.1 histidinol-phosphate aminotransferase [Rhodococcus sp. OK270]
MTVRTRPDLSRIAPYVPGRSFPGAIKLASNETTAGPLPSVMEAIAEAAAGANRYPDNGSVAVRDALAAKLGVSADRITTGCGSVGICLELVQATSGPGDEVIYAWRSFEAYPVVVKVAGATPVEVPLTADYEHDLDAMLAAITDRTRLIFICNPNNPTGTVVAAEALARFLDAVPPHILVALDEAYYEYVRPDAGAEAAPDGIALAEGRPNVVVLRTFSKAYGLAGLRIGYAIGDPEIIAALFKVHLPFAVTSVAQAAAVASLAADAELLARTDGVVAERTRVRDALIAGGYDVPPTSANFLWLPLGDQAAAFGEAGVAAKVLMRPFAGDGVRVTIGDPDENDTFLAFALGAGLPIWKASQQG